jgi:hypothetical protein
MEKCTKEIHHVPVQQQSWGLGLKKACTLRKSERKRYVETTDMVVVSAPLM